MVNEKEIRAIGRKFLIRGEFKSCEQIRNGNINQTFLVTYLRDGMDKRYIIQRLNTYVFKNPVEVMQNIAKVTEHIRTKIKLTGVTAKRSVLHFLYTIDGNNYAFDDKGAFWRGYRFIDESVSYDASENLIVLEEAGKAFGDFQRLLSDFDASSLHASIPDFHNTKKRLDTLFTIANEFGGERVSEAEEELEYIRSKKELASSLCVMLEKGTIPLRVTHNDTKCNNVLFDEHTHKSLAVIDLDTVMPGLAMYDFGDAVRFAANTAAEDEADTSLVSLDLKKYEAFTRGFIGAIGDSLTIREMETMALGTFAITIELASRFLLDYIMGDKYFKTNYEEHNIVRTRSQIALAKDIEKKMDLMNDIVMKYE